MTINERERVMCTSVYRQDWVRVLHQPSVAAATGTNLPVITADQCLTPYHFLQRWNSNWHSSIMQLWSRTQKISMADRATVASPLRPRPCHTSLGAREFRHHLRTNDFECPEPSFQSQDAGIDFPIRPVPTIPSVFYIKSCANGRPP